MYICQKCRKKYKVCKNNKKFLPLMDFLFFETPNENTCKCGGKIVRLSKCEKCGAEMISEYKLCDDCMDAYKTLDVALEIGRDWEDEVQLNSFLLRAFNKNEIEEILIKALKNVDETTLREKVCNYCDIDIQYFKEYAEKLWNNGK